LTKAAPVPVKLRRSITAALKLVEKRAALRPVPLAKNETLSELLEQCTQMIATRAEQGQEPIRVLHHFASTGGTVISKQLAACPNAILLSEIDPFSTLQIENETVKFSPTDLIRLTRYNTVRPVSDDVLADMFLAGLGELYQGICEQSQKLILRYHAHSHYCHGAHVSKQSIFQDVLAQKFRVLSVVTVRHPLDSFLSLRENGWLHFEPQTLDEYCTRYLAFLEDLKGTKVIKYEDFVKDTKGTLDVLCSLLELPEINISAPARDLFKLTGDSGRKGSTIKKRVRRELPESVRAETETSASYQQLCVSLKYLQQP